jgi:methylamine dehydrogenase heavy chain
MKKLCARFIGMAVVTFGVISQSFAADIFKPEVFTVEKAIKPGPNILVNAASWDGSSKIHVYGQDGLLYKGLMGIGLTSQFVVSADGKTAFVLSDYMKRYTYGPVESVLQIFDIATLTPVREILVPTKAVKAIGMTNLIELSADEKFLYIQNATPATSVTVVDLAQNKVVSEVPTPGCYGIYAAKKAGKFSTLCGSGQIKTYTLEGGEYKTETSTKIFDVDADPLYIHAQRRSNGQLIFTSFNGNLYLLDDSGKNVVLQEKLEVTRGIEGNWVPGGYAVSVYHKPSDQVFMVMHSGAYEGSHKDVSEEIWAYNLAKKKLVSRSEAIGLVALAVTQDKQPKLYGSNEEEETVDEYTVSDAKKYLFSKTASDEKAGWTTSLLVTP